MIKGEAEVLLQMFEQKLPEHYQSSVIRASQVQMALDILDFLQPSNPKRFLMIEAPVGTGKSLGALIPAMLSARATAKRVLYATSTINLQGQLMREEVPLLQSFGHIQKTILAMGKANYYCHIEYEKRSKQLVKYRDELLLFFSESDTGHRLDFEQQFFALENEIWDKVQLKGSKSDCDYCKHWNICPTRMHRQKFMFSNDLVVTNHDQLIRSVINKMNTEFPGGEIVPTRPGIVILDEAHDFQENCAGQLETVLYEREFAEISRLIPMDDREDYISLEQKVRKVLLGEKDRLQALSGRYPIPSEVFGLISGMKPILKATLERSVSNVNQIARKDPFKKIETILFSIDKILERSEYSSWVDYEELSLTTITRKFPKEFRSMLEYLEGPNKIIIMSGTLTSDGDFTHVLNSWRLKESEVVTRRFKSPFKYNKQAKIYVPEKLVKPRSQKESDPLYVRNQVQNIMKLIETTGGRTLILTTSKQHMDDVHHQLESFMKTLNIPLLKQGQASVQQLTKQFREDEQSVLIGTGSFYSGLSVPGKSLISVILTKLPFPVPDDPYLSLIGEGFEDELFARVMYPNMMVKLTQAVGRLIRDIGDYGVITILDPRLYEMKHYGELIRVAFEQLGYKFTRLEREITGFFKKCEENPPTIDYELYNRAAITISPRLSGEIIERKIDPKRSVRTESNTVENSTYEAITEYQWLYYEMMRKKKGKTKTRLKRIRSPWDLFVELYSLAHPNESEIRVLVEKFPYKSESQREELTAYKGQDLVTEFNLTSEEIAALDERLKKIR